MSFSTSVKTVGISGFIGISPYISGKLKQGGPLDFVVQEITLDNQIVSVSNTSSDSRNLPQIAKRRVNIVDANKSSQPQQQIKQINYQIKSLPPIELFSLQEIIGDHLVLISLRQLHEQWIRGEEDPKQSSVIFKIPSSKLYRTQFHNCMKIEFPFATAITGKKNENINQNNGDDDDNDGGIVNDVEQTTEYCICECKRSNILDILRTQINQMDIEKLQQFMITVDSPSIRIGQGLSRENRTKLHQSLASMHKWIRTKTEKIMLSPLSSSSSLPCKEAVSGKDFVESSVVVVSRVPQKKKTNKQPSHESVHRKKQKIITLQSNDDVTNDDAENTSLSLETSSTTLSSSSSSSLSSSSFGFIQIFVRKENCEHQDMIKSLSSFFQVHPNDVSVSGIKDKVAITHQAVVLKDIEGIIFQQLQTIFNSVNKKKDQNEKKSMNDDHEDDSMFSMHSACIPSVHLISSTTSSSTTSLSMDQDTNQLTSLKIPFHHNPSSSGSHIEVSASFKQISEPFQIGQNHAGNRFTVILRDIEFSHPEIKEDKDEDDVSSLPLLQRKWINEAVAQVEEKGFINFFGLQRVGEPILLNTIKNNHNNKSITEQEVMYKSAETWKVGKELMKRDYNAVIDLLLCGEKVYITSSTHKKIEDSSPLSLARKCWRDTNNIKKTLSMWPKSMIKERSLLQNMMRFGSQNKLKVVLSLPYKVRSFWIQAWQSMVFNQVVSLRILKYGYEQPVAGDLILLKENQHHIDKIRSSSSLSSSSSSRSSSSSIGHRNVIVWDGVSKLANGEKPTIKDVVLPLPGTNITYPAHASKGDYARIFIEHDVGHSLDCFNWANTVITNNNILSSPSMTSVANNEQDLSNYELQQKQSILNEQDEGCQNLKRLKTGIENQHEPPPRGAYRRIVQFPHSLTWLPLGNEIKKQGVMAKNEIISNAQFSFSLDVGTYATVMLRELTKNDGVLYSGDII